MRNSNSDAFFQMLMVGAVVFALLVFMLSQQVGLDFDHTLRLILSWIGIFAVAAGSAYFLSDTPARLGNIWPLLAGLFALTFWSPLDFWANPVAPPFDEMLNHPWWNEWYVKLLGVAAVTGGSFAIRGYFGRRSYF